MNISDVSASPHARNRASIREIMPGVYITMVPTAVYGVIRFDIHLFFMILMTILAAVLSEYLWQHGMKKKTTIANYSAVVTGLILALNTPLEISLWIPALGAVFVIIITKQIFDGLGQNFMSPAPAGRCSLLISFARYMNNFTSKSINFDATMGAMPLAVTETALKAGTPTTVDADLFQLFMGYVPGTIGEVSAIALFLGTVYLPWRKVISFEIPVIYIMTIAIFVLILGEHSLNYVLVQVLGDGLIFGVFFMTTGYASTPLTKRGQMIYTAIIGILTGLFRIFGIDTESASYSIIIGNILSPLTEDATIPKAFGRRETKKA